MLIHFMFQYHNMLNKCMCRNDAGHWFSPGTPVSSINKTDHHNIAEILLKVESNTINPLPTLLMKPEIIKNNNLSL